MIDENFIELLRSSGKELEVGGNQPVPMDQAQKVWFVESGKVEVFAIRDSIESGRPNRTHIVTVTEGQMLFGIAAKKRQRLFGSAALDNERAARLTAIGLRGTRLIELELAKLMELAREEELAPPLTELIEEWLMGLFGTVPRSAAPKHFEELFPGREVPLAEAGVAGRTRGGLVWVRHMSGRSYLLGRDELKMDAGGPLLPVSDETWLVSASEATLSCVATEVLLAGGGIWEGLGKFHDLFLEYVDLLVDQSIEEERLRLIRKTELDQLSMEQSFLRLASVLGAPGSEQQVSVDVSAEPLLAATRLVAESQGIEVRKPPKATSTAEGDYLARIGSASRFRRRRVILRGRWWEHDNGPILGFRILDPSKAKQDMLGGVDGDENKRPVALLPTSTSSYDLVDPVDQSRTPIDKELAEQLDGVAYMFYRPLPERPLIASDLVRTALRGQKKDLLTILAMGAAGGLLGLLVPIITGHLFGQVIPSADKPQLLQMTLALIVAAIGMGIFQITRAIAVLRLGGKMDGALQSAVWDRLLSLSPAFFRRYSVGDLSKRSMGIDVIRETATGHVVTSFLSAVFSLFNFGILFYYSWRLALVATALVVLLVAAILFLAYFQIRYQRILLEIDGKITGVLFGLISGISKLRIGGAEQRAFSQWASRFSEQRRQAIKVRRVMNLQLIFSSVYGLLSSLAIFAMVGLSAKVQLEVNEFLAFNAAYGQFQTAALAIVGIIPSVLTIVPIYERLRPILQEVPEVYEGQADAGVLSGDIEVNHVSFRYDKDGPLILDDVSWKAKPGEFVALVGGSGSGKSTCLRLILNFERPEAGSIYFDGQDLSTLDIQSVRRQIGVVLQGGRPMSGTIYSNIVGSSNVGMEAAIEAARMAGLEEDIRQMPMGMQTVVSEGAGTFSGGQVQRLLIARAIIHRPRILLFDEATSALDNRTQELVTQSLERLKATRIVVAHRLSTIKNADRIYVIEAGRVVESGTYQELVEQGGIFSELAERQVA